MILGIDVGTTNVKCVVFDNVANATLFQNSVSHAAYVNEVGHKREQNVGTIVDTLQILIESLPLELKHVITDIAVCGQMHGVCLWNDCCWVYNSESSKFCVLATGDSVHNLVTWEDTRCDSTFLQALPKSMYGRISSGFGCATLCWLSRNKASTLKKYRYSGTIMDFITSMLVGNPAPTTSPQLAYSWGYFDCIANEWEKPLLKNGFDDVLEILPSVFRTGSIIGKLSSPWLGLGCGTNIHVALGDFQCSALAAERAVVCKPSSSPPCIFNFGTGCQLAVPLSKDLGRDVEVWPYFENGYIAVVASLNGGNVIAHLMDLVRDFLFSLKLSPPSEEEMWSIAQSADFKQDSKFSIIPTLYGERRSPNSSMQLLNVTPSSRFDISSLLSALCLGLVTNVVSAYPDYFFSSIRDLQLICVGKAFRLPVLKGAVELVFSNTHSHINYVDEVNSALGAAVSVQIPSN